MDRVLEEKRASLASLHLSLPRQHPPMTPEPGRDFNGIFGNGNVDQKGKLLKGEE